MGIFDKIKKPKKKVVKPVELVSDINPGQCQHELWGVSHTRHHVLIEKIADITQKYVVPGKTEYEVVPKVFREALKLAANERERLYIVMEISQSIAEAKAMVDTPEGVDDVVKQIMDGIKTQAPPGSSEPRFKIVIDKKKNGK